jgi:hypothetical protein
MCVLYGWEAPAGDRGGRFRLSAWERMRGVSERGVLSDMRALMGCSEGRKLSWSGRKVQYEYLVDTAVAGCEARRRETRSTLTCHICTKNLKSHQKSRKTNQKDI